MQEQMKQNTYDLRPDISPLTQPKEHVPNVNDMDTKKLNCNFSLIPMSRVNCVMVKDINQKSLISNGVAFQSTMS
jgi:hypothetical protein